MFGRKKTLLEELRTVIAGQVKAQKTKRAAKKIIANLQEENEDLRDKCEQKVQYWQNLARQYYHEGLTLKELEPLLADMKDKRTNTDLMVELAVRDEDLSEVGREVRTFMDQLRHELMLDDTVVCGWSQQATEALVKKAQAAQKRQEKQLQGQQKRMLKRRREFAAQLEEKWHLSKTSALSKQLSVTLERAQMLLEIVQQKDHERPVDEAAQVLEFLNDFLTQGLDEKSQPKSKNKRVIVAK